MHADKLAVLKWIDEGNPNFEMTEPEIWREGDNSSLNSNDLGNVPAIYGILAHHQQTALWRHRELASELLRWANIFNTEFQLGVGEIALRIDWLPCYRFGHYCPEHNGFGLKNEIAINERYLRDREPWQILGTVLHELLHAWQQTHGKPGGPPYHNKQFRLKALSLGLVVDENGATQYLSTSPFKSLLQQYGVQMPDQPVPVRRQRGFSKLKKWSCRCGINVRVAIADFHARCLKCDSLFVQAR